MNNEKEIVRMAKVLYGHYCGNDKCGECKIASKYCMDYIRAERLHKAGIGDKKQAVKEAFDKAKEAIHNSCAHIEIDKSAAIPSYAIPESAIDKAIDELFTELYGAEE